MLAWRGLAMSQGQVDAGLRQVSGGCGSWWSVQPPEACEKSSAARR
jgi:hypothetical protein